MAGQGTATTENRSLVVGDVSEEVRALAAERKQLWQTYLDAETQEDREAVMPRIEELTGRINTKLKREFDESEYE
jgi:hypothetical protein